MQEAPAALRSGKAIDGEQALARASDLHDLGSADFTSRKSSLEQHPWSGSLHLTILSARCQEPQEDEAADDSDAQQVCRPTRASCARLEVMP